MKVYIKVAIMLLFITLIIIGTVVYKKRANEPFDSAPTSTQILFMNNEDLILFKTNKNSILLIDSNGQPKNLGLPLGMILPWKGTNTPSDWIYCNGTNSPNLQNRFILGVSTNRPIGTPPGGEEEVTLSKANIPPHTHNFTVTQLTMKGKDGGCGGNPKYNLGDYSNQETTSTGGSLPHNNMPPYYVLSYILYKSVRNSESTRQSSKILTFDTDGNSNTFTVNNDSLFVINDEGNVNSLSFMVGMVMMWHNKGKNPVLSEIPSGWALCDGKTVNGYETPDLKSRFVLGKSDTKPIGEKKGEANVTLSTSMIPAHKHNVQTASLGNDCFRDGSCFGTEALATSNRSRQRISDNGIGGGKPHNNMPPYYVLSYICYVGNISSSYGTLSPNKLILSDSNGNITPCQLKTDSILMFDSLGNPQSLPFPKGLIIYWFNVGMTGIPPGWSLCDGSTSQTGYVTPDLRNRFVLGYNPDGGEPIGPSNVGEEEVTLNLSHIPPHNHIAYDYETPNGFNCFAYGSGKWRDGGSTYTPFSDSGTVGQNGKATPHNNMPPYYVLTYICYTGDNL